MNESDHTKKTIQVKYIIICMLGIIIFLLYLPVINHEFINLDDPFYVYANRYINQGFTTTGIKWAFFSFHVSNWHPLTWLSHMLDCQIFGLDAGKHHIINLVFHIINTTLLFFIFYKSTNLFWPSFFIAAFFAIHPLHVESVAWISERKDLLSTFFMMITFLFYIEYNRSRCSINYWISVIFYLTFRSLKNPFL